METLLWRAIAIARPRVGWPRALFGMLAVLCLPQAASGSQLRLPAHLFFWAGIGGYVLGMWWAPSPTSGRRQRAALVLATGLVGLLGAAALALAVDGALPPGSLMAQDTAAWLDWLRQSANPTPNSYSLAFLGESLPRFWNDLLRAPDNGEPGARLLVALTSVLLGWTGALALGYALATERRLLGWSMPLLTALLLATLFGGTSTMGLVGGLAITLVLAVGGELQRHERDWDRSGADFSTELRLDVLGWGSLLIAGVLMVGWLIPAWFSNPIAAAIWPAVEPPSGLAVLERQAGPPRGGAPVAQIAISRLPALQLGQSIAQGPPEQLALRVWLAGPLPATEWPHYWRARLLDHYNGRSWQAEAQVTGQAALTFDTAGLDSVVVQTIESANAERGILPALPDVIGVDVALDAERLADGTLAALTSQQPIARYRVLSRPQEYAQLPRVDEPPPDMRSYLALPANLPPRIGELARALSGPASTPYRQALALEAHLRGLPYAYEVAPLPPSVDAVDQFLFEMRQGYCTYYASAMAILARTLGIPARVAMGYATGNYDATSGSYTVYESDAHAWPELYIDGRWLPFEPTPVRPLPPRSDGSQPATPPPLAPPPAQAVQSNGPLIWLGLLLSVLAASALGIWLAHRRTPSQTSAGRVVQIQRQLEQLGRRVGVLWPAGATLHEYAALLAARLGSTHEALATLTNLLEQARYGRRALTGDEERRLDAAWQQIAAATRRR